ncbi:MAG: IMP cyclohydrolase [Spirochaetes bacterium]|nr:MAG: IMP cyclohydrolase [Spirochaetota bacterium]
MSSEISSIYKRIYSDSFPDRMEINFIDRGGKQTLIYEKVQWNIGGERKGLRYGENPGQEAALYKLINGNIILGEVSTILPGKYLASNVELLQSGKHPGKINITDIDSALNILRYFNDSPCTVIVKHNNPSGVAIASKPSLSFYRALMADRVAAFGGAVAINREIDIETAELIAENYLEVVAAPEYKEGVLDILSKKKNLRVMRIENIKRLDEFIGTEVLDFKSLTDGGLIVQTSFTPKTLKKEDFSLARTTFNGKEYAINRKPTDREYEDMLFGWLVESGVTSNSVIYVKDRVTVGIGTGEQDRVGVAEIARDKAYKKMRDRISWELYRTSWYSLKEELRRKEIEEEVSRLRGGLKGSVMVSDAFFPFRDGVEVGLKEGVTAVVQPGGSLRDHESIQACNEYNATMVFTGQRSFRH